MSCRWNSHDRKTYIWLRTYRSLNICSAWLQERYVVICLIPYRKKNVEPAPVARSTIQRPSHCPVSRNEQRGLAPRKVYIQRCSLTIGYNCGCTSSARRIFAYTLQGAFPLLCSWLTVWSCEVLESSKPKRPENAFFNMFFLAHWQRTSYDALTLR